MAKERCHAQRTVEGKPSLVSAFSEVEYRKRYISTQEPQGSRHRRHAGGATKEPRTQSTQVVAHNA